MKVNLGCGRTPAEGYVNVDPFFPNNESIVCKDAADFLDGCHEGSIDEIRMIHVLEHMTMKQGVRLFGSMMRPLKVGGVLIMECPDIEGAMRLFLEFGPDPWIHSLYGGQKRLGDTHQWGYTQGSLRSLAETSGLIVDSIGPGIGGAGIRNKSACVRMIARKP